jgi:hypothetical protein
VHDAPSASARSAMIFEVNPRRRAHFSTFSAPTILNTCTDGMFFEKTSAW